MKCFVGFDMHAVIIEIPDPVGEKIYKYKKKFLDWIYDPKAKHPYLKKFKDSRGKPFYGACYNEEAFIEYLNKRVIKNKYPPAVIIERDVDPDACPEDMPAIFF